MNVTCDGRLICSIEMGSPSHLSTVTDKFCVLIPSPVRWALALDHQDLDVDRLYLGKGVPRGWLTTGKEISIKQAPTRWARVDYSIQAAGSGSVTAKNVLERRCRKSLR